MFSIGEFARLGGVSARTLRHYDEIGLLRPAAVDQDTGYRGYSAAQLGQLNRIMALKELGLSLTQVRRLLGGITLDELRGMLALRRAELENELHQRRSQLLGIEARLRSIAREDGMPADDIVVKVIPAMGVVALAGRAVGYAPQHVVTVVNQLDAQWDQLGIYNRVKEAGPRLVFFGPEHGRRRHCLPRHAGGRAPGRASRARPGTWCCRRSRRPRRCATARPAAIYPMVCHDLVRWIEERGYTPVPPGRDVWINEIDDIADVDQQVFETQLAFTRPGES